MRIVSQQVVCFYVWMYVEAKDVVLSVDVRLKRCVWLGEFVISRRSLLGGKGTYRHRAFGSYKSEGPGKSRQRVPRYPTQYTDLCTTSSTENTPYFANARPAASIHRYSQGCYLRDVHGWGSV